MVIILKRSWLYLVLIVSLLVLTGYLSQLCLIIEADSGNRLAIRTSVGAKFSLSFTHSVQKTQVDENFVIEPSKALLLHSTEYQSYGVGLPFLPSEGILKRNGSRFLLEGINRHFDTVQIRVGPEARHILLYHGKVYPLYQLFPPGALVTIRVGRYYSSWF